MPSKPQLDLFLGDSVIDSISASKVSLSNELLG